jgi:Flp pilus assembly protein CpaB
LQSVTLIVTPQQAELLDLGQNLGTLTLSLRNLHDTAVAKTELTNLATLLGLKAKAPMFAGLNLPSMFQNVMKPVVPEKAPEKTGEKAPPPQVWKIRTLRGSTTGEAVFEQK